ncbi:hypothetical protein E2C01_012156 [Portunus trituberculatus]|uniref:Uncharacterized protein n=1 Tax=Portunus trituberculatus TaxID=210409 RepID=A0A5B7DDA2_PORTR|nr:hypothetical protein [Portunus trituberculatus]
MAPPSLHRLSGWQAYPYTGVERGERADRRERIACDGWRERRCCTLHTSSQFPPPLPPLAARKGAMVQ